MPTARTQGGSATSRLQQQQQQPVSESDGGALAQKREYWRTKKREQRARLSEHRRSTQDRRGTNGSSHLLTGAAGHDSSQTASGPGSGPPDGGQRERWLQTVNLSRALLHISQSSGCVSARAAGSQEPAPSPARPSRAEGPPPRRDPDEEETARRREHWRVKKREQRAKSARAREKLLGPEASRRARAPDGAAARRPTPQTCLRESGRERRSFQVKGAFRTIERKNNRLRVCRGESPNPGEAQRKPHAFAHLSHAPGGVARHKTPRGKLAEVQNHTINQRTRRRGPHGDGDAPGVDPDDTPEQKLAKQREYWRNKKREQRAKLSGQVKAQLKEKDSLMRRVKRYQRILEELRCVRARGRAGGGLSAAPEAISGFIGEDGTVTSDVPQLRAYPGAATAARSPTAARQSEAERRRIATSRARQPDAWLRPPPAKVSGPPPSGPLKLVSVGRETRPARASGQLTLTRHGGPPTAGAAAAGCHQGGCVMKMAVRNAESTEEERTARRREYWRMKKREQRAARTAQLKRGLPHARISAAFHRRRVQRQVAAGLGPPVQSGTAAGAAPGRSPAASPRTGEVKQESDTAPEVHPDPDPHPDRAVKTPRSPTPEPDPSASADSQTRTLLAVASMKKLLEESLTGVTECKQEAASEVKVEPLEEELAPATGPNASRLPVTKEEADVDQATPTWDDRDTSAPGGSAGHDPKEEPHACRAPPSPSPSTALPLSAPSSRTSSSPGTQDSSVGSPAPQNQRLCYLEPPRLHHLPLDHPHLEPPRGLAPGAGGLSSLQRKREYWKLMKRQQRARLRARQAERGGGCGGSAPDRHTQAADGVPPLAGPPALHPRTCATFSHLEHRKRDPEPLHGAAQELWGDGAPSGPQPRVHRPTSTSTGSSHFLPALKPPDNPLFSIDLQPIEPVGRTPRSSPGRLAETPGGQVQKFAWEEHAAPAAPAPGRALAPPRLAPGDCREDFLRRRREYWRIKKKEQRAKKAIREKVGGQEATWRPALPSQDPTQGLQDSAPWVTSEEQHISAAVDADVDSFPYSSCVRAAVEGFPSKECEDAPLSDATWRKCYLMDYDPLNQLLVCMVCGDLQYSHSVEGVRGHIDEAHPDTLALDQAEKQRILEAWDQQVFQREQFFISQLQQQP